MWKTAPHNGLASCSTPHRWRSGKRRRVRVLLGGIAAHDPTVAVAMTAPDIVPTDLGRFGFFGLGATPEQAREIERLGYGTIWVGGSPPAELSFVEPLLESTTTLKV